MSKNTGWVLFDTTVDRYVDKDDLGQATLRVAKIYKTRALARCDKLRRDRVRKVRLENGKAVEVIKGR